MFLDVSANVLAMNMNEEQRGALATAIRYIRNKRFEGNRKAAYTAAGVNSATWDRLEKGETVKEQTLSKVLLRLVPRSEGDWELLFDGDKVSMTWDEIVGGEVKTPPGFVSGPGPEVEGGSTDRAVLDAVEAMRRDMQAMEQRLSERLEKLEGKDS